jgi:hypothetical protein
VIFSKAGLAYSIAAPGPDRSVMTIAFTLDSIAWSTRLACTRARASFHPR